MTGYAQHEHVAADGSSYLVRIKGVNNRFLDVHVHTSSSLAEYEPAIASAVTAVVNRGKVDVTATFRAVDRPPSFTVNFEAARAAHHALMQITRSVRVAGRPSLGDILGFDGVLTATDTGSRQLADHTALMDAVKHALVLWNAERAREGAATKDDLAAHVVRIRLALQTVAQAAPAAEEACRALVTAKFGEIAGSDVDPQRIYAEVASLLLKQSVSEEVARVRSHLDAVTELIDADGPIGKRLDFYCQELNREVNTIAGKSVPVEIHHAVVEAKDAIESIREQARNVE